MQGEPKKAKESSASSIPGKLYNNLFFSLLILFAVAGDHGSSLFSGFDDSDDDFEDLPTLAA